MLPEIDLSLERIAKLLAELGNPQDKLPPVIHIAGTNGKGSLIAYLTAILQASGYKVHRYISPHLVKFNERILIANQEISDEYLAEILERVNITPITPFEAITAAAFLAFAENDADIVLLETGLGGRLDATNLIKSPLLTAITPISLDHTEFLGDTLAKIAAEKAGIIKKNIPCVVGKQENEALEVINDTAKLLAAPLYRFGIEWNFQANEQGFFYNSAKRQQQFPLPNLVGKHQIYNAATAIACIDCIDKFKTTNEAITYGIKNAIWQARLQQLKTGKLAELLPENCELWLDGGHNQGAAEVISNWAATQKKPIHLILGMLTTKDSKNFINTLKKNIKSIYCVPIENEPLSQDVKTLAKIAQELDITNYIATNTASAIEGIKRTEKGEFLAIICGSLSLSGNILRENFSQDENS